MDELGGFFWMAVSAIRPLCCKYHRNKRQNLHPRFFEWIFFACMHLKLDVCFY